MATIEIPDQQTWVDKGLEWAGQTIDGKKGPDLVTPDDTYFVFNGNTDDFGMDLDMHGMTVRYNHRAAKKGPVNLHLVTNRLINFPRLSSKIERSSFLPFLGVGDNRGRGFVGLGSKALKGVQILQLNEREAYRNNTPLSTFRAMLREAIGS